MRLRIALWVAGLALVIILAQSIALLLMFDEMEEEFIDNLLTTQVEHSIELWRTSPQTAFPNTPEMDLFRLEAGAPAGSVPDNLARLPVGNHEIFEGGKEFHVAVREDGGARFILRYDVQEHEDRLDTIFAVIITGALLIGGVVLVLVYTLSGRLTRWLERLARQVRGEASDEELGEAAGQGGYARQGMEREVLAVAQALDALEQRQAELLAREREFTANLSHELRTPLTAIRTDGEMLSAQEGLPEAAYRRSRRIVDSADRIARLAESLLLLARETRPQLQDDLRLAAEIRQQWESLQTQYQRPVALQLEIAEPVLLRADPALLQLVLRNLLENALRHSAAGSVTCRLQGRVLEVADQGPGFAAADLSRVFERFYRGPGGGHGLGLALVAHVCRACGWVPAAANGEEGGAVLRVDLGDSLKTA